MARIEIKNVSKIYGGKKIVSNVSLSIGDGEFMVLVGPSGCGKTTMLRMIAGLEEISEGQIIIDGVVANNLTPRERDVAFVFQSYALYPHMTVRENMGFGLKVRGIDKKEIEKRVNETASLLEIDSLLDRYPKELSGGQRQRVAMGRAIVRRPKLFLFDEPLSNLDAALRSQMRVELKKLHHQLKATIIYVTHDHIEAMTLANRIAVIHQGVIQQTGTPMELFNFPKNKFVAGFIGSPPMNFIEGLYSVSEQNKIEGERFTIPVYGKLKKALEKWKGEKLEVGVRPQHLELWTGADSVPYNEKGVFTGTVEVMEPVGWETYLHVRLGNSTIIAHAQSQAVSRVQTGGEVKLIGDPGKIHIFSPQGVCLTSQLQNELANTENEYVFTE